jgi:alpha-beta hydrolase superfamily lysophospholipase
MNLADQTTVPLPRNGGAKPRSEKLGEGEVPFSDAPLSPPTHPHSCYPPNFAPVSSVAFRTFRRLMYLLLLLLLSSALFMTWWAGSEVASPSRRPLQDYHLEFLADPAVHGMKVQKFTLRDGTPCLMGEPDPTGKLGARGQILRDQFAKRGLPLPPAGQVLGNLVLIHGRKGRKEDFLLIAERLCAVGFRCLLADMPGHGDHPAELIYYGVKEAHLPAQVLAEAAETFGFAPQPVGLLGISMGGSVAMHATGQPDAPWKALAIISSFHAFQPAMELQASRMAGGLLGKPWASGAAWVYQWKTGMPLSAVQPHEHAARLQIPTLILHGTDDRIVPIQSGRKLYSALPVGIEKQWVEIPSADHHNVLITEFPVYATIAEWMARYVR